MPVGLKLAQMVTGRYNTWPGSAVEHDPNPYHSKERHVDTYEKTSS